MRGRGPGHGSTPTATGRPSRLIGPGLLASGILFVIAGFAFAFSEPGAWLAWTGLGLAAAGVALLLTSRRGALAIPALFAVFVFGLLALAAGSRLIESLK